MFEHLSAFRKILVSGPQRSGTTICAQMIAADLKYRYFDEMEFDVDNLRHVFAIVDALDRIVLQCPSLAASLWMFSRPDILVIFMKRDVAEIVASQSRPIYESSPDRIWTTAHQPVELMKYGRTTGVIAEVKYEGWEAQKPYIRNAMEIEYASLAAHPMWVDKAGRERFGPKQTGPSPRRT
jgi:hypothetical protein